MGVGVAVGVGVGVGGGSERVATAVALNDEPAYFNLTTISSSVFWVSEGDVYVANVSVVGATVPFFADQVLSTVDGTSLISKPLLS